MTGLQYGAAAVCVGAAVATGLLSLAALIRRRTRAAMDDARHTAREFSDFCERD